MRQVVLDTETTGLEPEAGHRIIEIGCVEVVNRRPTNNRFHRYLNPGRLVDRGAVEVHGIEDEFLAKQPRFAEVAHEFLEFVNGAELVIHNADFESSSSITSCAESTACPTRSATAARCSTHSRSHGECIPGSGTASTRSQSVTTSKLEARAARALLNAQILTEIYLSMTGGQVSLSLDTREEIVALGAQRSEARIDRSGLELPVVLATADELAAHDALLAKIAKRSGRVLDWAAAAAPGDLEPPASAAA